MIAILVVYMCVSGMSNFVALALTFNDKLSRAVHSGFLLIIQVGYFAFYIYN
ncbi:hypothetical protein AwEntero_08190 [Enterobacterales bacterium]|nr:hypothetical protein AwEntero_08190 [Enterobacterales bacterium]